MLQNIVTTDKALQDSIPGSAEGIFSRGELFYGIYGLIVVRLRILCQFSVLWCLQMMPLHPAEHRSENILQLFPCPFMCIQLQWRLKKKKLDSGVYVIAC